MRLQISTLKSKKSLDKLMQRRETKETDQNKNKEDGK